MSQQHISTEDLRKQFSWKSLNGRTLERIVNTELKASEVRKKVMKMLTEFRKGNSLFIKEDFL